MDKEKDVSYGIRYPQDILESMRKLAKEHGRSLNAEIVWALRKYIKQQEGEQKNDHQQKDQG